MVQVWGKHFCTYYLPLWLKSLTAPGNLPVLDWRDGHKMFIGCPAHDWNKYIQPLTQMVEPYVEVVPVELPGAEPDDDPIRYANVLQQVHNSTPLITAAYDPAAYGSMHSPDTIFSRGSIASVVLAASEGADLVLCPALRQREEPLIEELQQSGLLADVDLTPRVAAGLWVRHLHQEVLPFIDPIHPQLVHAPFRMYRLGDETIVLHTFWGLAVLMDFSKFSKDEIDSPHEMCFRTPMYHRCKNVRYLNSSDQMCILSLTPTRHRNMPTGLDRRAPTASEDISNIRSAYAAFATDRIRSERWFVPYVVHGGEPPSEEELQPIRTRVDAAIGLK